MQPELAFSFAVEVEVDPPIIVNRTPEGGKRQLIPIRGGVVSGQLEGQVMPGGVDSQIIRADGLCELSARYAIQTTSGHNVYLENNGIRRVPEPWRGALFGDDMAFFNQIPTEAIYFRATPRFEIYHPTLSWLRENIFICSGERSEKGVSLKFYRVL